VTILVGEWLSIESQPGSNWLIDLDMVKREVSGALHFGSLSKDYELENGFKP